MGDWWNSLMQQQSTTNLWGNVTALSASTVTAGGILGGNYGYDIAYTTSTANNDPPRVKAGPRGDNERWLDQRVNELRVPVA